MERISLLGIDAKQVKTYLERQQVYKPEQNIKRAGRIMRIQQPHMFRDLVKESKYIPTPEEKAAFFAGVELAYILTPGKIRRRVITQDQMNASKACLEASAYEEGDSVFTDPDWFVDNDLRCDSPKGYNFFMDTVADLADDTSEILAEAFSAGFMRTILPIYHSAESAQLAKDLEGFGS